MATTTTLQALPVPTATDDPDIPNDLLTLANAIEKRLAGVYNSTVDRDAKITAPQEGQLAIVKDTNRIYVYFDASWTQIYPYSGGVTITSGTGAPSNSTGSNGDVYFKLA